MTPWDELDAAIQAAEEAERHGDFAEILEARETVKHAHDRFSLFATSLFVAAAEDVYIPESVWSVMAERLGVQAAIEEAKRARRAARSALEELSGMKATIRSLEDRIDALTPGIGKD
jgi:hypothetical protein